MPFHYVRKTERASWSPEDMKNAVTACKQDGMSIRMAATRFNVPRSTLAHKVKLSAHDALPIRPPSLGRKPTLGLENEAELEHLILEVESRGFGLTKDDVCCLAFEFAERNNIKHDFNKDTCKAGRFWMEGFLKRHPRIVPRKAEGLSKASARGMNKEVVGQKFNHLGAVMDREGLHQHPERIYNVDETEHHSTSESDTESKMKEYICESSDKIDSQIDDDGWIVDEPGQDLNECGENRQDSPICTTSTSSTGSTTDSKRPLSDDMNHEGSGKILNLGNSRCAESVNNGQWLSYQINKKRKHGIDLVTSSNSEEPGFPDSNVASDPSFSFKYISQIGSMCLSAHPQDSGRDGSPGGDKDQKTSDVSKNLPDVIPDQSQQKFKTILDHLVKIADEATLAQTGACQAPSGYILKSFMYSPTKNMVTNQGRDDPGEKQKPRPSERARILRRKPCNQPKPTGQPDNRTFLALIPVVPPQSTPNATPIVETLSSTLDEKGKTDLKVDENKRVTRSQVKQVLPKPNQAELQGAIAQGKPILNPLFPGPLFRRIAPKPNLPPPNPQDPTFSKPQASAPILGSIFELVPVKLPASKILPENSTTERPFNPKTSSARRKQDPLSVQTRGEKWRQEESEMLIYESQEEGEEEQDQEVIHLIPDDEEGEVWEVVKMEI